MFNNFQCTFLNHLIYFYQMKRFIILSAVLFTTLSASFANTRDIELISIIDDFKIDQYFDSVHMDNHIVKVDFEKQILIAFIFELKFFGVNPEVVYYENAKQNEAVDERGIRGPPSNGINKFASITHSRNRLS